MAYKIKIKVNLENAYVIDCNYSSEDIKQANAKTIELLGFNFLKECSSDDHAIESKYAKILVDNEILFLEELTKEGSYLISDSIDYLYIYLDIIKLVLLDLQFNLDEDIEDLDLNELKNETVH